MLSWLRWADRQRWLFPFIDLAHLVAFRHDPILVGGVQLESPFILAAGLVKGDGFDDEAAALAAIEQGVNIMPGWLSLPRLVGAVEFGSFTRWPRTGNPGTVVWRDVPTRSTQNRIGLRNPGAAAAAAFLAARQSQLPPQYGINIAVSPGVVEVEAQTREVLESITFFVEHNVIPAWFTLNLSCPNTEDDPGLNQTADGARHTCSAVIDCLHAAGHNVPLWVKLGPTLDDTQYQVLVHVLAEVGVRAVVATNTMPAPTPDNPAVLAGVGGGRLHDRAVGVAALLVRENIAHAYPVDVIGCGGVHGGAAFSDFMRVGVPVVQYWSALVYRGPLAAALIGQETKG
jgi:dihydroorotate dehydrogenase